MTIIVLSFLDFHLHFLDFHLKRQFLQFNSNYISNFSPQLLLTELRCEIQRRESFKNVSCVKDDKAPYISTVSSTSDTEENDFDVTFYKYRREIEQKMYYIDDTIQSERA